MSRNESAGGGAGIKNARAWVPQSRARPLSGGKLTPRRQLHPEAAAAAAAEKFERQRADKAAARRAAAAAAGCAARGGLLTGGRATGRRFRRPDHECHNSAGRYERYAHLLLY